MIKNFDTELKDLDGNVLKDNDISMTMKKIVSNALNTVTQDEQSSGDEKAHRYYLSVKIYAGGDVDVSAEDIVLIKQQVGKVYTPLVVGQVFDFLK